MYRLLSGGVSTGILCSSNDISYGCTAFVGDSNHAYPYGTSNPVTIPIETDYLLDVVPSEVSVEAFHPTAIQAQAIAARSYAYWHINQGSAINNSNQFQVFVPYAFEALQSVTLPDNPANPCASTNLNRDQRIVCDAVAPRYYITYGTYPNDDLPAFTEYFADVPTRTVSGGYPYLIAVDDPISSHPEIVQYCNLYPKECGHGHGMSQKGASRWARGNLSYNINRDLGSWSVRWERAEQILLHYYTGVHIRDADNGNARLTPFYRWNPLQINWGMSANHPPIMYHGSQYAVTIEVQNTGTLDWTCDFLTSDYRLSYHWAKVGYSEIPGTSSVSMCGVHKGDPSRTVNLIIQDIPQWGAGAYTIRFDIYRIFKGYSRIIWFSPNWPTYDVSVCVDGPCQSFLPLILKNSP